MDKVSKMKIIKDFILISIISIGFATANYFINANRPNTELLPDEITLKSVNRLPTNLIIVDARSISDFNKGHIKNAVNLSEAKFDEQLGAFLDIWTPESTILVYCNSGSCNSSRNIADKLKHECNIKNVYVLKDDWKKWKK